MMQVADELSIEELKLNLRTYREQLQQVTELLAEDPSNSEYAEMEKELREGSTTSLHNGRRLFCWSSLQGALSCGGLSC